MKGISLINIAKWQSFTLVLRYKWKVSMKGPALRECGSSGEDVSMNAVIIQRNWGGNTFRGAKPRQRYCSNHIWHIETVWPEQILLPCTMCIWWKTYKRTPSFFLFPWYLSNICQKHLFVEERITNISFLSQEQLYLLPLQRIHRYTYRVLQTIVCHSIRSMFRVLGIYNFECIQEGIPEKSDLFSCAPANVCKEFTLEYRKMH
jgi:hypothetical protein